MSPDRDIIGEEMQSGWWKHKNVWHPDASKPTTGSPTLWQLLIRNPPLQSQLLHLMVKKGLSENCKNLKKQCADEHRLQIALKEYQQGQDGTTTKNCHDADCHDLAENTSCQGHVIRDFPLMAFYTLSCLCFQLKIPFFFNIQNRKRYFCQCIYLHL